MSDHVCVDKRTAGNVLISIENLTLEVPPILFADVLTDIETASGLTKGVRSNMKKAVLTMAHRVSASGLQGAVDIQKLQAEFERLTPAMLNFKTDGALAGFKSNLRRALRLAGIDIMPGKHVTPLTPAWTKLMAGFDGNQISIKLSRFAHVASKEGWDPEDICRGHLERFRVILKTTNLGSKADKVIRGTIAAWSHGQRHIDRWPGGDLGLPPAQTRFYALPWSDFPESFQQDVEKYLSRENASFLGQLEEVANAGIAKFLTENMRSGRARRPLRKRTKDNYRSAFRRAASILVQGGKPAASIAGIADLVAVPDVLKILTFLSDRTKKEEGGHLGYMALVLFFAARDHVKVRPDHAGMLEALWEKVRGLRGEMSKRSFARLRQFDDEAAKTKMAALPKILATAARRHGKIDTVSIKLFRTALFTAIGLDTANRAGNITNLELERHVSLRPAGKKWMAEIANPASEVKNNQDLFSVVKPDTAALLREWIDRYRPALLKEYGGESKYLFPSQGGGHLSGSLATQSLKDAAAYYAGLDMTPHAIRAYLGKLILDEFPDAYPDVQRLLGHKRLETTLNYYAPVMPMAARRRMQQLLLRCEEAYRDTL